MCEDLEAVKEVVCEGLVDLSQTYITYWKCRIATKVLLAHELEVRVGDRDVGSSHLKIAKLCRTHLESFTEARGGGETVCDLAVVCGVKIGARAACETAWSGRRGPWRA